MKLRYLGLLVNEATVFRFVKSMKLRYLGLLVNEAMVFRFVSQ
jgi:hypothetical protein